MRSAMAREPRTWTELELRGLYEEYMDGARPGTLASRRSRLSAELISLFQSRQWPLRGRASRVMPRRVADELILAMHAEYMTGLPLTAVARRHKRSGRALRDLFSSRGLFIREATAFPNKGAGGRFEPVCPRSEAEIEAMIAASTRMVIPIELKNDWAKWPMQRRGDFIARLRAHLADPQARPDLPFSGNVLPFDYATEEAWEIVRRRNAGKPSWTWETKLNIISQGVIWDGRLWFWARRMPAYYEGIKWTPGHSRPALHRAIWESLHGPLPAGAVIRGVDGNPNNLEPANLILTDRNELVRENQMRHLVRRSRDLTSTLLNRHQSTTSHAHPDLNDIRARR